MRKKQLSTSPSVVFGNSNDNTTKLLDDGSRLLVEGEAVLLDHLAICDQGVWDKGGDPAGVDNGGAQVAAETEEELKARKDAEDKAKADAEEKARKDAEGKAGDDLHAKLDKIMDCIGTMNSRMDALESAKKDSEAEEKAKKDAEEKARMDSETKARLDAMEAAIKPRADSEAA